MREELHEVRARVHALEDGRHAALPVAQREHGEARARHRERAARREVDRALAARREERRRPQRDRERERGERGDVGRRGAERHRDAGEHADDDGDHRAAARAPHEERGANEPRREGGEAREAERGPRGQTEGARDDEGEGVRRVLRGRVAVGRRIAHPRGRGVEGAQREPVRVHARLEEPGGRERRVIAHRVDEGARHLDHRRRRRALDAHAPGDGGAPGEEHVQRAVRPLEERHGAQAQQRRHHEDQRAEDR
jgi:hypothetical protein